MRTFALPMLVCLAVALPSAADAKKQKSDTPEDKLSCKQIAGRMQVSIIEARGFAGSKQASSLSRGIQWGLATSLGNTAHGIDPQGEHAASLQKLREDNQRLVEKGCKSYDLDAELQKSDIADVPTPTVLPPKKKKASAPAQ